jgi:prepilin-type N-terminal cleavage/methylation domain-containing protein
MHSSSNKLTGFTLIEISIVLIIIGLIVGGILVGRDLIAAAEIRAQITQIEKFNTAANTFRVKFGQFPGDINGPNATAFGLAPRGIYQGEGDGNNIIEGNRADAVWASGGWLQDGGETQMFWYDLSTQNLIEGNYTSGSSTVAPVTPINASSTPSIDTYFPPAKIGKTNHIFVHSYGGQNYYYLAAATVQGAPNNGVLTNTFTLTPREALNIDSKVDDGFPQSGRVLAQMTSGIWVRQDTGPAFNTALQLLYGQCYDNGFSAGVVRTYSLGSGWNGSASVINADSSSCALSFRFQ